MKSIFTALSSARLAVMKLSAKLSAVIGNISSLLLYSIYLYFFFYHYYYNVIIIIISLKAS